MRAWGGVGVGEGAGVDGRFRLIFTLFWLNIHFVLVLCRRAYKAVYDVARFILLIFCYLRASVFDNLLY